LATSTGKPILCKIKHMSVATPDTGAMGERRASRNLWEMLNRNNSQSGWGIHSPIKGVPRQGMQNRAVTVTHQRLILAIILAHDRLTWR
jgi:hypothetical protein